MTRFGMHVSLAHPKEYTLIPEIMDVAKANAAKSGGKFEVVKTMDEAFKDADIVYPKSWAPYAVMGKRTELLKKNDTEGLKELEKKCLANNAKFMDWECTEEKMKLTKNGKGLYMHCYQQISLMFLANTVKLQLLYLIDTELKPTKKLVTSHTSSLL